MELENRPESPQIGRDQEDRDLTENIPAELLDAVKEMSPEQAGGVIRSFIALKAESYNGPLPHPDIIERYENIIPGSAERLLAMAERQQEHRINCDNKIISGSISQSSRGQWMGFILCVLFGLLSAWMAYIGEAILAGIIAGGTIVSLAVVFALNREPKASKDKDKDNTII